LQWGINVYSNLSCHKLQSSFSSFLEVYIYLESE
jgi:hypothetical protein